jgi:hypothetical protein
VPRCLTFDLGVTYVYPKCEVYPEHGIWPQLFPRCTLSVVFGLSCALDVQQHGVDLCFVPFVRVKICIRLRGYDLRLVIMVL